MEAKNTINAELTFYDYWRIINKRRGVALLVFGLTFTSTFFFTLLQPPLYKSQATIKYQPPASYAKIPGSDIAEWDPRMSTELNVLTSVEIAERAAEKLHLIVENGDPDANAKVIDSILASYHVERLKDSNLITIYAESPVQHKAGGLINAVIDAYREYDLAQKNRQGAKTLGEVAARRLEVGENLHSLEQSKQKFVENNPELGATAVLAGQLAELKNTKIEFLEKYTPDHPERRRIEQKIQAVELELRRIPSIELSLARIDRELKMQEDLYTALNKQYEEAKLGLSSAVSFISIINPPPLNDVPVSPNIRIKLVGGTILGLFLSLTLVFILENLDVSIGTIEEIESFVGFPVLGVIPVIPARKHSGTNWLGRLFKKGAGAGSRESVPITRKSAYIHRAREHVGSYRSVLLTNHMYSADVIESYHSFRLNLISKLDATREKGIAVVFTSASAGEGKSLTAMNFAVASAHAGLRTLLVDADIRRPVVHRVLGLAKQPGLSDILVHKQDWRAALCESTDLITSGGDAEAISRFLGVNSLKVLTCGTTYGNTMGFFDSYDWAGFVNDLKKEFDIIVFDTPPVLLFIDAIVLAKNTDGVVLVYKAGKVARGAVKRATEQVMGSNVRMIGVFLNGVRAFESSPNYAQYYPPYTYKKSRSLKF